MIRGRMTGKQYKQAITNAYGVQGDRPRRRQTPATGRPARRYAMFVGGVRALTTAKTRSEARADMKHDTGLTTTAGLALFDLGSGEDRRLTNPRPHPCERSAKASTATRSSS